MNDLVSIIIPCYNDSDFIEKAVGSALNQSYPNIEVIVVDDGSDFKTKAVLKLLEPRITKLITQENKGQSIARNNAIRQAQGTYILNLDSDDYFEPSFCEKAVRKFEEDGAVKIVTCLANRFNAKGSIDVFKPRGGDVQDFLYANSALGSSMFKRQDWEQTGGYEEDLPILGFEDWEFYIQLLKHGGYAYVLNEVLFHYQVRENSTTDRIRDLKLDKFEHIIFKHKDLYKDNFEGLVVNLLGRIKQESFEKVKNTKRIDYVVGNKLIKPLRWIKGMIK
jgi:glycosyltransferase involved in cell wall biosynthesis